MSHPEDSCERCGNQNPSWSVDSDRFNIAMKALGLERSVIVCPSCFVKGHEKATGMSCSWNLVPGTPFRWLDTLTKENNDG
jgi:hypothetical protein